MRRLSLGSKGVGPIIEVWTSSDACDGTDLLAFLLPDFWVRHRSPRIQYTRLLQDIVGWPGIQESRLEPKECNLLLMDRRTIGIPCGGGEYEF